MSLSTAELSDLIGSCRFTFVIMRYADKRSIFDKIVGWVQESPGMRCVRADDVPAAGEFIPEKVHQLINCAEFIIADLSDPTLNVYYEVGYARALGKRVLVICKKGTVLQVDIQGVERLDYSDTTEGLFFFEHQIKQHISAAVDSDRRLLRSTLVGARALPAYILASPLRDTARAQDEHRTYGDNLGVVGIVSAFGSLMGQDRLPELLEASHARKDILKQDANLYVIGSPRANDFCAEALTMLQRNVANGWHFNTTRNSPSCLVGQVKEEPFRHEANHSDELPRFDYALFMRGPHPDHQGRRICVMAGTRSLGSGAACLVATRPELLRKLAAMLPPKTLEDHKRTIWALVKATPDPKDNHASVECTEIHSAGVY